MNMRTWTHKITAAPVQGTLISRRKRSAARTSDRREKRLLIVCVTCVLITFRMQAVMRRQDHLTENMTLRFFCRNQLDRAWSRSSRNIEKLPSPSLSYSPRLRPSAIWAVRPFHRWWMVTVLLKARDEGHPLMSPVNSMQVLYRAASARQRIVQQEIEPIEITAQASTDYED